MRLPWPALARSLASAARRSLVQAWTDYYESSYDWAVIKAWRAASLATGLLDPMEESPVGYRLLRLDCDQAREASWEAAVLDGLYLLARDPWLQMVLGDNHSLDRGDALDAIEAAVKIVDAATGCNQAKPEPPKLPAPPDWAPHALRLGPILIIIDDDLAETRAPQRIKGARHRLPPGYYTVILSGDEALAYASLPPAKAYAETGELEVLADSTGLASMIAEAVNAPR